MGVDLQALSRSGNAPFSLLLNDNSGLHVDAIVRRVANKRLVCAGQWQYQRVYAKLFIGERAEHYAMRDAQGVKALAAADILTPALLAHTQSAQAEILIFAAINDAENAETVWDSLDKKSQFTLAQNLVMTLAKHHNAGLIQTDLYLKNFLVQANLKQAEQIYTLDGDGIRQYALITAKQAKQNLSILLSKFDVLDLETWLDDLLKVYRQARVVTLDFDALNMKHVIKRHRLKVASAYADKKVFRQCSDVNVDKHTHFSAIATDFTALDLPQDAQVYDQMIETGLNLKNGNTCTVALVKLDQKAVVLKRYNIKNIGHFLSRMLRPSRAAESWANAYRMQLLGLPTAKPIALLETRYFSLLGLHLRGKAYFLAEYIDAPDLAEFFAGNKNKAQRAKAIKLMVQLLYRLYLLNISHGDMKATNIKVTQEQQPRLIDLDSMQQHRQAQIAYKAHVRDLKRFMQNWQAEPALYNAFKKVFKIIYTDPAPLHAAGIQD